MPVDQRHNIEMCETNGRDRVIASGLGLSLLAYGPRPPVVWNLAQVLMEEVEREDAMRWVPQVEDNPRLTIRAEALRQGWERHRREFRLLVEKFVADPNEADTALVAGIDQLYRERAEINDAARRLPVDRAKAESERLNDLREALRRVQRENRGPANG
jgi:hypothetical protein